MTTDEAQRIWVQHHDWCDGESVDVGETIPVLSCECDLTGVCNCRGVVVQRGRYWRSSYGTSGRWLLVEVPKR